MSRPFNRNTPLGELMYVEGWSASEVSAASGIHPRTLSEYLSGRREPLEEHLLALADVLEVDVETLLTGVGI